MHTKGNAATADEETRVTQIPPRPAGETVPTPPTPGGHTRARTPQTPRPKGPRNPPGTLETLPGREAVSREGVSPGQNPPEAHETDSPAPSTSFAELRQPKTVNGGGASGRAVAPWPSPPTAAMQHLGGYDVYAPAFCLLTIHTHGQKKEDATAEEVKIEVLHVPKECKPKSKKGDLLNAHYDGYLASDGSKFYCSRTQNKGHPKWFVLGVGQVIKGLDIAMTDMCPGEKRKVTIPPSLAYGKQGYGSA
uniref:peptidylprolyl isomerase n=1 Tax=Chelydra serpentina TaxID=8475 RepID=A0A8C3XM32_CHESE